MAFVGILGEEICEREEKKSIFDDFNLGVCISQINSLSKGYDLQALYMSIPKNRTTTEYRRAVTKDLQNRELRETFEQYAKDMETAKKKEKQSEYSHVFPQKEKWHMDALCVYAEAVENLYKQLTENRGLSEGIQSLLSYLENILSSAEYKEWRKRQRELTDKLRSGDVLFSLQKNKVVLEEEGPEEGFGERVLRAFSVEKKEPSRFRMAESEDISIFERAIAERVVYRSGIEEEMRRLMSVSMDDKLLQLAFDIQYYLGFFRFAEERMTDGYPFCVPEEGSEMKIRAGYDVAMATKDEKRVIANDFQMEERERFFVITGANGGGKTTYARMVGQILYFARMGLMVPCEEAVLPHFTDVLSHFSKEETEASGRGKLVEELVRLQPMMKGNNRNCFVILNELFTTAATLDAGIMGQKVLAHFMQLGCRGIYVTHIQALAEEKDGVVSMVAELEEDHHTRSFRIARKPAEEGEYEDSLITKYHMTYEQMKAVMNDVD